MLYNQYMPNSGNHGLNEAQHRFVDLVGRMMAAWNLPPATGRVYGYLLLSREPVSLDRMAAELQMSKSGASVAGRVLETWALARRTSERGSRRVLYEASDNLEAMMAANNRGAQDFIDVFRQGAAVAPPGAARNRMQEMAEFFAMVIEETEQIVRRWRERRQA